MKRTGKRFIAALLLFCTVLIGAAGYEVLAADETQSTENTSPRLPYRTEASTPRRNKSSYVAASPERSSDPRSISRPYPKVRCGSSIRERRICVPDGFSTARSGQMRRRNDCSARSPCRHSSISTCHSSCGVLPSIQGTSCSSPRKALLG